MVVLDFSLFPFSFFFFSSLKPSNLQHPLFLWKSFFRTDGRGLHPSTSGDVSRQGIGFFKTCSSLQDTLNGKQNMYVRCNVSETKGALCTQPVWVEALGLLSCGVILLPPFGWWAWEKCKFVTLSDVMAWCSHLFLRGLSWPLLKDPSL